MIFISFSFLFIPYVLALASIISKNYTKLLNNLVKHFNWIKIAEKYNKFGLFFLALGILFGAFWAYNSFGWGGFWNWDTIENAALIPMILSIIFLHSSLTFQRNFDLLKTNYLIAIFIFPTILLSTFLARSGVLTSISNHTYANSIPIINYIILSFLFLILLIPIILFWVGLKNILSVQKQIKQHKNKQKSLTLSLSILSFIFMAFVVFIGTFLSIVFSFFGKNIPILTPLFYISWLIPISIIWTILLAIIPFFDKEKIDFTKFSNKILPTFALSLIGMIFIFYFGVKQLEYILLTFACLFAIFSQSQNLIKIIVIKKSFSLRKLGMFLGHLGICFFILGCLLYGTFEKNLTVELEENQSKNIFGKYTILFNKMINNEVFDGMKLSAEIEILNENEKLYPYIFYKYSKKMTIPENYPDVKLFEINDLYISPISFLSNNKTPFLILELNKKKASKFDKNMKFQLLEIDKTEQIGKIEIENYNKNLEKILLDTISFNINLINKKVKQNSQIDYNWFEIPNSIYQFAVADVQKIQENSPEIGRASGRERV